MNSKIVVLGSVFVVSLLVLSSLVSAQSGNTLADDVAAVMTQVAQGADAQPLLNGLAEKYCPCPTTLTTISGTDSQATQKFKLPAGLVIFRSQVTGGERLFVVDLLNDEGDEISTIAMESGVSDTSKAVKIEQAGTYLFNVRANGAWTITMSQ